MAPHKQRGPAEKHASSFADLGLDILPDPAKFMTKGTIQETAFTSPQIIYSEKHRHISFTMNPLPPLRDMPKGKKGMIEIKTDGDLKAVREAMPIGISRTVFADFEGVVTIKTGPPDGKKVLATKPGQFLDFIHSQKIVNPTFGFQKDTFYFTHDGIKVALAVHFVGHASIVSGDQGGREIFGTDYPKGGAREARIQAGL